MPSVASKVEHNQQTINEYMEIHNTDDVDLRAVAQWAIATGRWESEPYDPIKACARELSRAARQEYYTDPQNRQVRRKHCYVITEPDGQRRWHWVDIGAPPDKIHLAFQQRRQSAYRDVKQLHTDLSSYNDNNQHGAMIQMSFNFDEDLADEAQPDTYPEGPDQG